MGVSQATVKTILSEVLKNLEGRVAGLPKSTLIRLIRQVLARIEDDEKDPQSLSLGEGQSSSSGLQDSQTQAHTALGRV